MVNHNNQRAGGGNGFFPDIYHVWYFTCHLSAIWTGR